MSEAEDKVSRIINDVGELSSKILNEKQRRLVSGCISKAFGYGGDKIVGAAFGLDPRTVSVGRSLINANNLDDTSERVRLPGAGRKSATTLQPDIAKAVEDIVSNNTYGSPEKILLWTNLSLRDISEELQKQGFKASKDLVGRMLESLGYSKQVYQKHMQIGKEHPDRDEMFRRINLTIEEFCKNGNPVISTDTKKKELIGNFKNNGAEYRKEKDSRKVLDHDFPIPELGKVAPYGIYVVNDNTGFVNLGTDHDTGEFAVESIHRWWLHIGKENFKDSNKIMVVCDSGGSNGWRPRLWKYQLAMLAEEIGKEIHVYHMPPGTSKWNKVEHRLFCYITKNWEGKPLLDIKTVVNYISNTKTKKGLNVQCVVDENKYECSIKISDEQIETVDIEKIEPNGDYAYIIRGFKNYN